MAHGVYIICSESGAIDRLTNAVSMFSVLETILFGDPLSVADGETLPIGGKPWINIRMTSLWRRTEDEAGTAFDYQITFSLPGDDQKRIVDEGSFIFKSPMHRFVIDFGGPQLNKEGILRVENKIRKVDEEEWTTQAYEIRIEKITSVKKHAPPADS